MSEMESKILCVACGSLNRVPFGKGLAKAKCGRCGAALATLQPVDVTSLQLLALESKDTGAFMLDVWAPWCGPCRMMAPHYATAASEFSNALRFFKLDSDKNRDAAERLQIRGIPTLIGWNEGRQIAHQAGAQTGPALGAWIRQSFKLGPATN